MTNPEGDDLLPRSQSKVVPVFWRHTALPITKESLSIGFFASLAWPFKQMSAANALFKNPLYSALLKQNGGMLPRNFQHPSVFVMYQMAGNCFVHRAVETYLKNRRSMNTIEDSSFVVPDSVKVAAGAALGACWGSWSMVAKELKPELTNWQALFQLNKRPQVFWLMMLGYQAEVAREWKYNLFCLNLDDILKPYSLGRVETIAATAAFSGAAGYVSGVPNYFACRFYAKAINSDVNLMPRGRQWQSLHNSCRRRMFGISVVFTLKKLAELIASSFAGQASFNP
jgi:hypothetical protein